jgi:hypothetical protein
MDTIAYREELKRLGMDKDLADLIAHAPERLGGGYVTRDYLDAKLGKLENRIDALENKINAMFYRLAGLMFIMGTAYTAILFWLLKYFTP